MADHSGEPLALRLLLSFASGNDDAMVAALDEFVGRCTGCTANVLWELCRMVAFAFNELEEISGVEWEPVLQARLAELLDMAAAG